MVQLVALQGNIQQNNALGSFQNAQTHQQNLLQSNQEMAQRSQAMEQGAQAHQSNMKGQELQQAEKILQLIGAAGMHALGGKIDGTPDPAKYEEGLDMLESQGLDVSSFRGKPHMANVAARASVTAMQAMQMAQNEEQHAFALKKFEADMAAGERDAALRERGMTIQEKALEQGKMQPGYRSTTDGNMEAIPGGPADPKNPLNQTKTAGDAPSGYRVGQGGNLEAIPGGPADPDNPLNTRKVTAPMTAGDKKAIFAAQDELPIIDNTISSLNRALELLPQTSEGFGANQIGKYGSQLPESLRPENAEPTREYLDIMTGEAATQMSAVLKGATTDKELGIFMSIISDTSKPRAVRERALKRMIALAESMKKTKTDRIAALQGDAQPGDMQPSQAPSKYKIGSTATNKATGQKMVYTESGWSPAQ